MQHGQLHVCTGIRVLVQMDSKEGITAEHELDALCPIITKGNSAHTTELSSCEYR